MQLGDHTIDVIRATTAEDEYGNEEPDWPHATETTETGWSIQPLIGSEVTVGRETVVSRWRAFGPKDSILTATDRVRFQGSTYEVDGEVQRWDFPPLSHVVALLRKGD